MHRGPAEKFGPLSFYAFPGSWYRACALRVFLVLPAPGPPSYAPQGVEATQFPRGPASQNRTPRRRGIAWSGTHLVPRPAEPVGQRPGRTRGGLPGLRDRAPPLLNNKRRPPSCSTVEAKRGAGIESEKRACQFCSNRVKWEPRGTEIMRRTPGAANT